MTCRPFLNRSDLRNSSDEGPAIDEEVDVQRGADRVRVEVEDSSIVSEVCRKDG